MLAPRTIKWWACGRYEVASRLHRLTIWLRVEVILMPNMYVPMFAGGDRVTPVLWMSVPVSIDDFYLSDDRMLIARLLLPLKRYELPVQVEEV